VRVLAVFLLVYLETVLRYVSTIGYPLDDLLVNLTVIYRVSVILAVLGRSRAQPEKTG
jgi:hypothetical protein